MVRAKFRCIDKQPNEYGSLIKLETVMSGSEENEKFFKFTPYGQLSMGTVNPAASDQFEVGKEYFVDFSPAE